MDLGTVRRFEIWPDGNETWVALQAQRGNVAPYDLLVSHQLRLSAPANMAADYAVSIHSPDELLATHTDASHAERVPCMYMLARIRAHHFGVDIPQRTPATSAVTRLAHTLYGWSVSRVRPSSPDRIPIDLVWEHVYLGFVPATAVRMALVLLPVLAAAACLVPVMHRVVVARPHWKRA